MKKTVLLLLFTVAGCVLYAQVSYRSYNTAGVVMGESKSAFQVLTTHGVQHKTWYVGIGAGVDNYRSRTVPVILSVLKDILPQNNMFVNVSGGPQFLWGKAQMNHRWNAIESRAVPGFFGEAGLGYRIAVGNEGQSIMFGTYYSYKTHKEKYIVPGVCNNPPCQNGTEYITSQFSRWAFKLGLVF